MWTSLLAVVVFANTIGGMGVSDFVPCILSCSPPANPTSIFRINQEERRRTNLSFYARRTAPYSELLASTYDTINRSGTSA